MRALFWACLKSSLLLHKLDARLTADKHVGMNQMIILHLDFSLGG